MKGLFSRRAFVAGAPGAIAAAPMIADTVAKTLASGGSNSLAGSIGVGTAEYAGDLALQGNAISKGQSPYDNPAIKSLHKQIRRQDRARQSRYQVRALSGGFDPDLAMLRSPSLGARIRIQNERDRRFEAEGRSFSRLINEKVAELAKSMGLSDYPTRYIDPDDGDEE